MGGGRTTRLPKRRLVIRVESEETQDHVLERRRYGDVSQEEVEEIDFVLSASSEPRGAVHWCENQCSGHGFKFNQIGTMATEEGGEAHAITLCKRCYCESPARQRRHPVKAVEWRDCRAESFSWQAMEGFQDGTIHARDVGIFHRPKSMG